MNRDDKGLTFSEAVSYASVTQPMREAHEMADRAAKKYLSFEGVKTIEGLMDLVGMHISKVENLSPEGRDIVLGEIRSSYSKKITEMD
jgi:hypothetical protein